MIYGLAILVGDFVGKLLPFLRDEEGSHCFE